jgi:hypothetical protein
MTRYERGPFAIYFSSSDSRWSHVIRAASFSNISHVLLADTNAILDLNPIYGVIYRTHIEYMESEEWVDCFPLGDDLPNPRLGDWENAPPANKWRCAVKYLSLGLVPYAGDCVGIAREALRRAGIKVPFWVTTPNGLYRWLKRKGYGQRTRSTKSSTDIRQGPGGAVG